MNALPVFFSFDNNYVVQAAVTFESLLTNARECDFYELHVVHEDITSENRARLKDLVDSHGNARLSFIDATAALSGIEFEFTDKNFFTGDDRVVFTKETLFRCLPTLIPDFDRYDKILYSDVDICVVDDISELFDLDLSGHYLAGCRCPQFLDCYIEHLPEKFTGKYFAGGLWLMNLKKMRQDNLVDAILAIIKDPPVRLIWNDQDIMNLACDLKVKYFSCRYISIPRWDDSLRKTNYFDEYYPNGELYDAMFRPKIVHYAYAKPWNERCGGVDLWYYWLNKTKFYEDFQRLEVELVPHQKKVVSVPQQKKEESISIRKIKMKLFSLISIPSFLISARTEGSRLVIKCCGFILTVRIRLTF